MLILRGIGRLYGDGNDDDDDDDRKVGVEALMGAMALSVYFYVFCWPSLCYCLI